MSRHWSDDPKLDDFEGYIADVAPHLSGASWSDPDLQAYYKQFNGKSAASVAASRAAGAQKAAKTRAKNATQGISQKYIAGTTRQKQWASQIRGDATKSMGEDFREFFDGRDTHASFWIDNRNGDWRHVFGQCQKRWQDYLDAVSNRAKAKQDGDFSGVQSAERKLTDATRAYYRSVGL